ncbi:MAG: hypothetical protein AAGA32_21500 [Pseudomonadota bacterium]
MSDVGRDAVLGRFERLRRGQRHGPPNDTLVFRALLCSLSLHQRYGTACQGRTDEQWRMLQMVSLNPDAPVAPADRPVVARHTARFLADANRVLSTAEQRRSAISGAQV